MLANAHQPMKFGLDPLIEEMRDTVSRFVDDKISPRAGEIDQTNTFPRDLWPALGDWGYMASPCPRTMAGWVWGIWPTA